MAIKLEEGEGVRPSGLTISRGTIFCGFPYRYFAKHLFIYNFEILTDWNKIFKIKVLYHRRELCRRI